VRYLSPCLWTLVLSAVVVAVASCGDKARWASPADGGSGQPSSGGVAADNSRCHVCHINYEDEKLAVVHARARIGCEQCHGASDAHCSDEDNVTPPEIMFPRAKVNPFCMMCHPEEKIAIQAHQPVLTAIRAREKHCTDCHGKHRLSRRTRTWDKGTGKLIEG